MKLALAVSLLASIALAGCAGNLCKRKERYFTEKCAGKIPYSDATCEMNLDRCSAQQKAAMEGYVMCLEALPGCSMDAIGSCSSAHPQGVNLMCTGT